MIDDRFMRPSSLIGLAAILILSACSTTPMSSSKPTKYPIYEMSSAIVRPVFPTGDQNLAWLDDERVLFEGLDRELRDPVETNQGVRVAMRGLYIWNIRTNEVIRYTREALRSFLCFADGYVSYSVYRNGKVVWMEGPFGREQEVVPMSAAPPSLNQFTCKSYDRATLPKPKIGGGIEPLRPEHGWLEHTGNSTWFRSVEDRLRQFSYDGKPIGPVVPQKYSFYSQKYIYWRPSQNVTWLIEPTGILQRVPLPAGLPTESRLEPAAQEKTLLRSRRINVRANWDPGDSGLYSYAMDGKPAERVLAGLIDAMQVHRTGCLVAAIVDPWDREGREHRLRAVTICQ
jgi:hypothetical protein